MDSTIRIGEEAWWQNEAIFPVPSIEERVFDELNMRSCELFGKEAYLINIDGIVFSRISKKTMTLDEAVQEFRTHVEKVLTQEKEMYSRLLTNRSTQKE